MANGCSWEVSSLAEGPDGKLYIGSRAQACGQVAGLLYTYDPSTNEFATLGDFSTDSGLSAAIFDVAVTGDDLYAVGFFDRVDGVQVNGVAHYDFSTQTWSSVGTGPENGVTDGFAGSVAADGASVYLGFRSASNSQVGTLPVDGIARWDRGAGTWSAMNGGLHRPDPNDPSGNIARVGDLFIESGTLFVGGAFDTAGGTAMPNVATFDPVSGWTAIGAGVDGTVNALASDGASVFAAGSFTEASSGAATDLLEFDGTDWVSLAPPLADVGFAGSTAESLLVSNGFLYLGGWFSGVDGLAANNIARLDLTARTWQTLGTGSENGVRGSMASGLFRSAAAALASVGDAVYAAGFLTRAGGNAVNNIAKWDTVTGTWSAIGSASGQGVNAQEIWSLSTTDTEVLAGGPLAQSGGARTSWVGRYGIASRTWSAFGNVSTRQFFSVLGQIAATSGEIFATSSSGLTDSIDSYSTFDPINGIVRWDPVAHDWALMGPAGSEGLTSGGSTASARSIVAGDGDLYVSGSFDMAGATAVNNIAHWDVAGETWSALGSGLDAAADELLVAPNGDLIAAGSFTSAGGLATNGFARWDPVAGAWSTFGGSGVDNVGGGNVFVLDLALLPNGDVVVAGLFDTAGAISANGIARWDGTQWHALDDGLTTAAGDPAQVEALAVAENGDLFAGGNFTQSGTQPLARLARWDGSGWSPVGPSPAESGIDGFAVDALALLGPDLFVGGDFGRAGGEVAANFAHFVRDLGGPQLAMSVSPGGGAPPDGVRGAVSPAVYTVTIENLGDNNAFDTLFDVELSPAPVSVSWTCTPLPGSAAVCPQPSGASEPSLLLDLPFGSGLSFELTVNPDASTVFQDIDAGAAAPAQFGDPGNGTAAASGTAPVSSEAVFKNDFE